MFTNIESKRYTCYRQDEEPWRIDRLRVVHGFAKGRLSAVAAVIHFPDLDELVTNLHDHKGCLTVTWRVTPTSYLKEHYAAAWSDQNEDPSTVEHAVDLTAAAN